MLSEPNQKIAWGGKKRAHQSFRIVLIKPSHYDDDGYVIQWYRSAIPSNTLASLYGLVKEAAESHALGRKIGIVIDAYDETNTIIPIEQIVADIEAADQGVVGLVGVQTNQFPRAVDISRRLRKRGIQVAMGGFHVSAASRCFPNCRRTSRRRWISAFHFMPANAKTGSRSF